MHKLGVFINETKIPCIYFLSIWLWMLLGRYITIHSLIFTWNNVMIFIWATAVTIKAHQISYKKGFEKRNLSELH